MKEVINQRLRDLREVMCREHLDAFIFPSTDPHNSEYVPDRWKGREWVSGFNGSAGTAVVTMHSAALWTDSRYFLAAADQLSGTEYQLMKLKVKGTPTIAQWLGQELHDVDGAVVGMDGMVNSCSSVEAMIADLRQEGGITVRHNFDPLSVVWRDRPAIPDHRVEIQPLEYAGERAADKLARIRKALRTLHADGMLVSALDDVAWTLNLRGTDVHCNPVFVAYLLIDTTHATLYINKEKVSDGVRDYLAGEGVGVAPYADVAKGLKRYPEYNILLDLNETCYSLYRVASCRPVVSHASPVPAMKAIKNETEIAGFHRAMLRDGIALVKFLRWLKPAVEAGGQTEMSIDRKLTALRAEQPLFRDISFDTIAGYGTHGAIVHYEATPETDIPLEPHGFLLVDSGGQYYEGTTDITRTIAVGPLTEDEKKHFALVLRSMLRLANAKFLYGCRGLNLDILARGPLWDEGLDYKHGTGHGVGYLLNVHEGPNGFRWKVVPERVDSCVYEEGMITSDEPGIYIEGSHGIRTENLIVCRKGEKNEYGQFMYFETLTCAPIDLDAIDPDLLNADEKRMLNDYHRFVYDTLSPLMDAEEREWLAKYTRAI